MTKPLAFACLALLPALAWSAARAAQDAEYERPYRVENGKVDQATFNGYRRYGNSCLQCHGPDGSGSSYAPNLTDSLKHMTHEQFNYVVINGRQNVTASQQNVMPSFGHVEDVVMYLDDIYAYLKARSDGVLGRGRPERLPR
ncbi:c-type cytochrome [Roseicella aquatilis]|uniref:C-type cytochrome n=1 Tax=Roseicella aquatilis TaxID=2527868 RepID=A0A4R4DW58_9PROT|nr:cytochrome c [Roseicella aquatilis]TCZ64898.1 c-type cytochrome [Roseicella aquatilis]